MSELTAREAPLPFDETARALCGRDRAASLALLEERGSLTWLEASEYAPLTLRWAPDLLERILDMVSEGKEELFCLYCFPRPGGGWSIDVCASLLTAAAALDDLEAVELLLKRGYQTDEDALYRGIHLSPHFYQLGRIRSNTQIWLMNAVFLHDSADPLQHASLEHAGPLAAAIFCGAKRCALRLLREMAEPLTLPVRRALIRPELGDPAFPAAVEAVTAALGAELPDLLDPEDFLDREDPRFLECLKRGAGRMDHRPLIRYMILRGSQEAWAREGLRYVDPVALSGCLLELLEDCSSSLRRPKDVHLAEIKYIFYDRHLDLVLDRNAVSPNLDTDVLLEYLDNARVVGEVPSGALSGLAANLLDSIPPTGPMTKWVQRVASCGRRGRKALSLLAEEDPALIEAFKRRSGGSVPIQNIYLLLSLLDVQRKEDNYEL